jgi:ABC-2 type transport system permease protein
MKNVFRFLFLDFFTLKTTIKSIMFFILFMLIGIFSNNSAMAIAMIFVPILIFSSYPFAVADKYRLDTLYLSLPLTRRHIVLGRYIFCVLLVVTSLVAGVLMMAVMNLRGSVIDILQETIQFSFICFFYVLIYSIQAPLWFRFGYVKTQAVALIPYILVGFAIPALFLFSKNTGGSSGMQILNSFTDRMANSYAVSIFLGLIILMLCISFVISLKVYEGRDF